MKGLSDEPQYSIDLLDGGTLLHHVVDNHISEQTLVMHLKQCRALVLKIYFLLRRHDNIFQRRDLCFTRT